MKNVLERADSFCACDTCKRMCRQSPCFPTPAEAQILIDKGYADRLRVSAFIDQETDQMYPAISPKWDSTNGCTFQSPKTGLCELHDLGLKPTEGRLAHHSKDDEGLRVEVSKTWYSKEGVKTMKAFPTDDPEFRDSMAGLLTLKFLLKVALKQLTDKQSNTPDNDSTNNDPNHNG